MTGFDGVNDCAKLGEAERKGAMPTNKGRILRIMARISLILRAGGRADGMPDCVWLATRANRGQDRADKIWMMLKIIAGEFRSRPLVAPADESISRPYGSRVKESIFNLLRGWFEGATVLDLF